MLTASLFIFALFVLYVLYRLFESFSTNAKSIETQATHNDEPKNLTSEQLASQSSTTEANRQYADIPPASDVDHEIYKPIDVSQSEVDPIDLDNISSQEFAQSSTENPGITDTEFANTGIPYNGDDDTSTLDTSASNTGASNPNAIASDTATDEVTTLNSESLGDSANNGNYTHQLEQSSSPTTPNNETDFAAGGAGATAKTALGAAAGIGAAAAVLANSNAEDNSDALENTASTSAQAQTDTNSVETSDEDMDIGDMTMDVSEMLKELNLRESDSPRLDIDSEEYQQLKTGEPGQVKPEKIEKVAVRLRTMLH